MNPILLAFVWIKVFWHALVVWSDLLNSPLGYILVHLPLLFDHFLSFDFSFRNQLIKLVTGDFELVGHLPKSTDLGLSDYRLFLELGKFLQRVMRFML